MAERIAALRPENGGETSVGDDVDVVNHLLFEVCSEVGRQVGGVHTVLKTKAAVTTPKYGARYTLIGRLQCQTRAREFDQMEPPSSEMADAMEALRNHNVKTFYGKWLIEGNPRVLLIDVTAATPYFEEWKDDYRRLSGVSLPPEDEMSNDAMSFGYLVHWFFKEFLSRERHKAVIAHFHEWPSCLAAFLAKEEKLAMATIFTAHATVLGRDLCNHDVDLYNVISSLDADAEARKSAFYHRHGIERLAAQSCDVMTTVSDITSLECEYLLGRRAEVILPNGISDGEMSSTTNNSASVTLRHNMKAKIRDFLHGHFYGQLDTFNAAKSLYFFTAGRYEYTNKGVDMFIQALARLNERLKASEDELPTVVAFIIMPAEISSMSAEVLHRQAIVRTLQGAVSAIERRIEKKLFDRTLVWKPGATLPTETELVTDADNAALRRCLYGIRTETIPPVVTHDIVDIDHDPIATRLQEVGLRNDASDKVKVVFHPDFLNPSSSVFPIDYDEFVRGTHLGVFPSKYEPWGYTSAECLSKGIPSVTSNVSGFGSHMEKLVQGVSGPEHGLYIVDRRKKSFDESVEQIVDYMHALCMTNQWERVAQRNNTDRLGVFLDWKELNVEYRKARMMALRRKYPQARDLSDKDEEVPQRRPQIRQRSELSLSLSSMPTVGV